LESWRSWLGLAAGLVAALVASTAGADHPGGLRSEGWSPLTTALVFAGLALLAGAIVVVVIAILTRREDTSSE
jgi:drug/metabolite transporter (DMT)-like permease